MDLFKAKSELLPMLSLLWLGMKVIVYLILAMVSSDLVVVAYQKF